MSSLERATAYARLRAGAAFFLAGAFFAVDFLAGAFLAVELFAGVRSPESMLFLSAAIRSTTLLPFGCLSGSSSWMTRLPFLRCFSAISFFSASM